MSSVRLVTAIMAQYPLPMNGVHGPAHWARVRENGLYLAPLTGADPEVVKLFALLHDSRRTTEGWDNDHGPDAADFALTLRGDLIQLDDPRFDLLYEACAHHTDGDTEADVTIQTCWDADRLDLGRVGIRPDPARLCTEAARDSKLIAWATERAVSGYQADILDEWLRPGD